MQQIRQYATGGPEVLTLETVDDPRPGPGQILVRVESASVNFSDVMRRRGDVYPFPTPLPYTPGSEVAGTVEELGEGVLGPPVGTRVLALLGTEGGGYAAYAVAPAAQVVPLPPGLDVDAASALAVAGVTASLLLSSAARLEKGESVLVHGAGGGVGLLVVQLAKEMGATVIGAAGTTARRQAATAAGADFVIDYTRPQWGQEVRDLTGGRGVDVVLDAVGGQVFTESLTALAPFGRVVVYGMAGGTALSLKDDELRMLFYDPSPNQSLHAFNVGLYFGLRPELAIAALSQVVTGVASGTLRIEVGAVLPLQQAHHAHRLLEDRAVTGKVVLKPWA